MMIRTATPLYYQRQTMAWLEALSQLPNGLYASSASSLSRACVKAGLLDKSFTSKNKPKRALELLIAAGAWERVSIWRVKKIKEFDFDEAVLTACDAKKRVQRQLCEAKSNTKPVSKTTSDSRRRQSIARTFIAVLRGLKPGEYFAHEIYRACAKSAPNLTKIQLSNGALRALDALRNEGVVTHNGVSGPYSVWTIKDRGVDERRPVPPSAVPWLDLTQMQNGIATLNHMMRRILKELGVEEK